MDRWNNNTFYISNAVDEPSAKKRAAYKKSRGITSVDSGISLRDLKKGGWNSFPNS